MEKDTSWSWGNIPKATHTLNAFDWLDLALPQISDEETMLPYGRGRSYGDVPINDGAILIPVTSLDRFISFDKKIGVLKCEAGVSLSSILDVVVPQGWFLPTTPGTKFVTLGGAIANDVHGKNHHVAGTFGCHVIGFELLRSDNKRIWCSPTSHLELFRASIGGLGLTGLITIVELQLIPVKGTMMDVYNIAFSNIDEGLDLFARSDKKASYTVAWIDCLARGKALGRGIFTSGEHSTKDIVQPRSNRRLAVPFNLPRLTLNKWSVKAFNEIYFRNGHFKQGKASVDYEPFFYPLDRISSWNRIYGKSGFYQYQCVIPMGANDEGRDTIRRILYYIAKSGNASFLAVLKIFGDISSPGMLSFPMPGITLALDFANRGQLTLDLLSKLDGVVVKVGGKVYPAKDARMTAESFNSYFPVWKQFSNYIDPKFSSSFWRRVTGIS